MGGGGRASVVQKRRGGGRGCGIAYVGPADSDAGDG